MNPIVRDRVTGRTTEHRADWDESRRHRLGGGVLQVITFRSTGSIKLRCPLDSLPGSAGRWQGRCIWSGWKNRQSPWFRAQEGEV